MICLLRHVSYAFARSLGGNHIDTSLHLCVERVSAACLVVTVPCLSKEVFPHARTERRPLWGQWSREFVLRLRIHLVQSLWTIRPMMDLQSCSCRTPRADNTVVPLIPSPR